MTNRRRTSKSTNGWRAGYDPIQRWLRVVTTIVVLGVFVYLAVLPERGADGVVVIALALGAVLMLLGYESFVKLPMISWSNQPQNPYDYSPYDPTGNDPRVPEIAGPSDEDLGEEGRPN